MKKGGRTKGNSETSEDGSSRETTIPVNHVPNCQKKIRSVALRPLTRQALGVGANREALGGIKLTPLLLTLYLRNA